MRHARKVDPDRYLHQRDGIYYYWRRIPAAVAKLDTRQRSSLKRISLKTDDLAEARAKRDALEAADTDFWTAVGVDGDPADRALLRYQAAVRRAEFLGFPYRTAPEVASGSITDIVRRIAAILPERTPHEVETAVLGGETRPRTSWKKVFEEEYEVTIMKTYLAKKSPAQLKRWRSTHLGALDAFVAVVGDIAINDTTRAHALAFHDHWLSKVTPDDPRGRRWDPSTANRQLGILRTIYRRYYARMQDTSRVANNPFDGLSFPEGGQKKKRPPFDQEWIRDKLLVPGALARMNGQLRGMTLALVETGCRPAELCNILPSDIFLDADVPHIHVRARTDPDDTRDVKTVQSDRQVPLVGVALEVFKQHPNGFPRYKDKEDSFSAAANKYLKENGLKPTPEHVVYSLRHSFEDRMIEGGIDLEVREVLMGHKLDRPMYGEKGSLRFRQKVLSAIAFDFDPVIV